MKLGGGVGSDGAKVLELVVVMLVVELVVVILIGSAIRSVDGCESGGKMTIN